MPTAENLSLSVVVPVYKEEKNVPKFLERIRPALASLGNYEIIFCMDPSPDATEKVIRDECALDSRISLLTFCRRVGQPAATMAGVFNCRGAACVVIDVDLQDPPELIPTMAARMAEGFDVVFARRRSRQGETLFKRFISFWGYKLINAISDVSIPAHTGDFRIINRRVIEELRQLPERHGFLRGLVALVGLRQTFVEYDRHERFAGEGNYNRYLGSLKIAFNGIIGFSTKPLFFLLISGVAIAFLGFLGILYMLFAKFVFQEDYPLGIPTLSILVMFLGGVQLIAIGILGEYIGRIYEEVRQRPLYVIDNAINIPVTDSHGPRIVPRLKNAA